MGLYSYRTRAQMKPALISSHCAVQFFAEACLCQDPHAVPFTAMERSGKASAEIPPHCDSGEVIWLQGEAALQTHSFRDADPQPVVLQNAKKFHGMSPKHFRPGLNTSLITTNPCLYSTAWQCSVVFYSRNSQLGLRNVMG